MQPRMALIWQRAPVSYRGRFSLPGCSRNNCFEVTLAVAVVSCCASVPFCQLKGYLDLLTVTKGLNRGQTFCTSSEWSFLGCTFYTRASAGRKSSVIHQGQSSLSQTFAVWRAHKGLNSRLDCLLHSWLGGLECSSELWWARTGLHCQTHPYNSSYC